MKEKLPPQALEMEQAVLGAAMIQRDALIRIADVLRPEMFYEPKHRTIYAACIDPELDAANRPIPGLGDVDVRLFGSLEPNCLG